MFGLLRNRDFGLLWLAGLIAFAGNTAWIFALPLHIYRETESTLATAGVMAAGLVPRILFSSVAGVFVDQWDRKRTMVVTISAQAVLLLPVLAAPNDLPLLYAVAAIQGIVGLFLRPAEGALLPKLVGDRLWGRRPVGIVVGDERLVEIEEDRFHRAGIISNRAAPRSRWQHLRADAPQSHVWHYSRSCAAEPAGVIDGSEVAGRRTHHRCTLPLAWKGAFLPTTRRSTRWTQRLAKVE